jgi:hypothetical protein
MLRSNELHAESSNLLITKNSLNEPSAAQGISSTMYLVKMAQEAATGTVVIIIS